MDALIREKRGVKPLTFCAVPGVSPLFDFLRLIESGLRPAELLVALAVVCILGLWPWAAAREPALWDLGTPSPEVQRRVRRAAMLFFLLTGFARVFLLAQAFNSGPWFGVTFWLNVHAVMFATPSGFAAWFRPLLLWGVGQLEPFQLAPRLRQRILAGFWVALMLTFPFTAHALAVPASQPYGWLSRLAHTLHLFAGFMWVGGLAVFAVVTTKGRANGGMPSPLVSGMRRFFSATLAVLAVGWGTGLLLAWMRLTAWSDLWVTRYGFLLSGKLVLAALALLLTALIRFLLLPRVDASGEEQGEMTRRARIILTWALRLKLAVALILLILGGVLASISPPN